jgi:CRP-like cAMP-binding protein
MVTAEEIGAVAVFAALGATERGRLSRTAADISLVPGEYAAHEGDERAIFAVLAGRIEAVKTVDGVERVLGERQPGDIFGEVPIVLGTVFPVGFRARYPQTGAAARSAAALARLALFSFLFASRCRFLAFALALGVSAFCTARLAFLSLLLALASRRLAPSTAAVALLHSSLPAGEAVVRAVQVTVPESQAKGGNVLILKLPLACCTLPKEPFSVVVPLELLKAWLMIGKG